MKNFTMTVNKAYEPLFKSSKKIKYLTGGYGSGKTFAASQKVIINALSYRNSIHFIPNLKEFLLVLDYAGITYTESKAHRFVVLANNSKIQEANTAALYRILRPRLKEDVTTIHIDDSDKDIIPDVGIFLLRLLPEGEIIITSNYEKNIIGNKDALLHIATKTDDNSFLDDFTKQYIKDKKHE
jgi:hypothetical protein